MPGAAFWEKGGAVLDPGCAIERMGIDISDPGVAGHLLDLRHQLETARDAEAADAATPSADRDRAAVTSPGA